MINKIPYIKNIDGFISSAYITEDGGVCYIEEYNPAYTDDNMGGHIIHYILTHIHNKTIINSLFKIQVMLGF